MTSFCQSAAAVGVDSKAAAALRTRLLSLLDPAVATLPSSAQVLAPWAARLEARTLVDLDRGLALLLEDLAAWVGLSAGPRPPPSPDTQSAAPVAGAGERPAFPLALRALMRRHFDTTGRLHAALIREEPGFTRPALCAWLRGCDLPVHVRNFGRLRIMEDRYGLAAGYFREHTSLGGRTVRRHPLADFSRREQAIVAWHIPNDYESRSLSEQSAVSAWVRRNVLPGATPFRAWQTPVAQEPFALQFSLGALSSTDGDVSSAQGRRRERAPERGRPGRRRPTAPDGLNREIDALVTFKTAPLTPVDLHRRRTWRLATAQLQVSQLAALFGALIRSPQARGPGLGLEPDACSAALLVMPQVWDWFLAWRYARRGCYTGSEDTLIRLASALCSRRFGWLRQNPQLKDRLVALPPLFSQTDVEVVRDDWSAACDRLERFGVSRLRDIGRLSRKHRDPFEPIEAVLRSPSPLGDYRKIATEAARYLPDRMRSPKERAEALRFILIFRLALHLGFRQRSLRELTFRPKGWMRSCGDAPDTPNAELSWCEQTRRWTVSAPPSAFKNSDSSFFCGQPYFQGLADVDGLYSLIEEYIADSRPLLLGEAPESAILFVKSMQRGSTRSCLSTNAFYKIWYDGVRRFGIYNPFTGRGAIQGLLPHGPHSVRDVIATHVLKTTGSFVTASYAIQDTPRTVEKHYGRFFPIDKVGIAADVLNRVWAD